MENKKTKGHICVSSTDIGKEEKIFYKVQAEEILMDLKYLIKEFYVGIFNNNGNTLVISLSNGQKFNLTITEN